MQARLDEDSTLMLKQSTVALNVIINRLQHLNTWVNGFHMNRREEKLKDENVVVKFYSPDLVNGWPQEQISFEAESIL